MPQVASIGQAEGKSGYFPSGFYFNFVVRDVELRKLHSHTDVHGHVVGDLLS